MIATNVKTAYCYLVLISLPFVSTADAQAFRCVEGDKTVYQDSPCAQGNQSAVKLNERSPTDFATEFNRSREWADDVLKSCKPGSAECARAKRALELVKEGEAAVVVMRETAPKLELKDEVAKADARINFRVAKDDYERASKAVEASYGSDNFYAVLASRSAAHDRLSKARSAYYRAYKQWPD